MNLSNRPLRARTATPRALFHAFQWRLLVLWVAASLLCALLASLPVWSWLGKTLDHSLLAPAIAAGTAPVALLDALMSRTAPLLTIGTLTWVSTGLMLLLSPLLVAATLAAARSESTLCFGDLLRNAIGSYFPLLRMLVWSILPFGLAIAVMSGLMGYNASTHEHAILASELAPGRTFALVVGGVLLVLAHASIEAGRGWLGADTSLRSAIKAWWRGTKLLLRRPLATLSAYLIPTLFSLLLALALLMLRQSLGSTGLGSVVLAMLLACTMSAALAWGKAARLFALSQLAGDSHRRRGGR